MGFQTGQARGVSPNAGAPSKNAFLDARQHRDDVLRVESCLLRPGDDRHCDGSNRLEKLPHPVCDGYFEKRPETDSIRITAVQNNFG